MDPEGVAESGVEDEGTGGVAGGGAGDGGVGGVSRCAGFNQSVSCRPLRSRVKYILVSSLHHSTWGRIAEQCKEEEKVWNWVAI